MYVGRAYKTGCRKNDPQFEHSIKIRGKMWQYLNDVKRNQFVRCLQFVFAALVLALSTYTLVSFNDWKQVRFTVAAVRLT